jgi:hypothetical protein
MSETISSKNETEVAAELLKAANAAAQEALPELYVTPCWV